MMFMDNACVPNLEKNHLSASAFSAFVEDIVPKGRRTLSDSMNLEAAQLVQELDLLDESEDEGEIMLLAMILLQLHGVRFQDTSIVSADDHNKKKRQRTSPEQLAILEQIFQTDKMPSQQTRVQLADQLGMSSRRVQIWFQNKRAKVKRGLGRSSDGLQPPSPEDSDESSMPANSDSPLEQQIPSSPEVSPKRSNRGPVSPRNLAPFPFVSSFESPPLLVNFSH